jgi:diguanylate cyclase (GGDEF)-like protein/PAS domain S-box-containing protein
MLSDGLFARLVGEHVSDAIILTDASGIVVWINSAFSRLTGYDLNELVGKRPGNILQGKESCLESRKTLASAIYNHTLCCVDIVNYTKSGKQYIAEVNLAPIFDQHQNIEYFIAIQRDVTAQRSPSQESIDLKAYRKALDQQAIVSVADPQGKITFVNAKFSAISGYTSDELIGKNHRVINSGTHDRAFFVQMWQRISQGYTWHGEVCNKAKSGNLYWVDTTIVPVLGPDNAILRYVSTRYDITERKAAEGELLRVANIDKLTGLANRSCIYHELKTRLHISAQNIASSDGLLIILDLDHFKDLNDTLGHHYGDILLQEISRRLLFLCGPNSMVARVGGNEFAAIIPVSDMTEQQVNLLLNNVHNNASEALMLYDDAYTPSFSMGVTRYPADGQTLENILINADIALHEAKRKGRNGWIAFNIELKEKLEYRRYLKTILNDALQHDLFTIAMQPICTMQSSEHRGFEVLARLSDNGKPIRPDLFIPLAEELGLIIPLGQVIMQKAMAAMRKMLDLGLAPGTLALNVAAPQLQKYDFVDSVKEMLRKYQLEPAILIIEVTETALIGRSGNTVAKALTELQGLGIQVALDDFGTGFSSLSHLRDFNVDKIKIDKSFINDLEHNADDRALVEGLINFAQRLGLEVVAEGVETQAQQQLLQNFGCQYLQGYLHSHPLSVEDVIIFIQERHKVALPVSCDCSNNL